MSSQGVDAVVANREVELRFDLDQRVGFARVISESEERRRVGDVLGAKYDWDGDEDSNLSRHAWCYDVPAIGIDHWKPRPAK